MANTDFDEPDVLEEPADFVQRRAHLNYLAAQDADPEETARAVQVGQSAGIPASVVGTDLEGFEKQHLSELSNNIIKNNKALQQYLADPTAAKLSHDDIGPLDKASESMEGLQGKSAVRQWMDTASRSFMRGFGEEPWGQTLIQRPEDLEWAVSHPAVFSALSAPALGVEALSRVTSGVLAMGYEGASAMFGEPFARDLAGMAETAMMRGDIGVSGLGGGLRRPAPVFREAFEKGAREAGLVPAAEAEVPKPPPEVKPEERAEAVLKHAEELRSLFHGMQVGEVFTRAGEEPPPHIDPLLDKAKEAEVKESLDRLKQAVADAQQTATRERSPDHFQRFADLHGPGEIGIDISKIKEVYGDTVPPELEWIEGLQDRMDMADVYPGDVWVDRSEFLAKTERETVNQLGDGLRLRDGLPTVGETKIDVEPKQVVAQPLAAIRGGAGAEPEGLNGDRKITLRRRERPEEEVEEGMEHLHDFTIHDERGNPIGIVNLSEHEGGRQIHIDNVQAGKATDYFYTPNFLGPSAIMDIGRQLKALFPKAFGPDGLGMTGHRVTGARKRAGAISGEVSRPVVKFDIGEDPQAFRDLLGGYWEEVYPGVEAVFGTPERGLAANSPMGQIVLSLIRQLAPGAEGDIAQAMRFGPRGAHGAYLPDLRSIIVALTSHDPLGTARHEVIHFLRDSGLIDEKEWAALVARVKEEGWRGKDHYDIDGRYGDFYRERFKDPKELEDKLNEEAVAHAFPDWVNGKLKVEDPTTFQKIKDFLEGLKRAVLDHFGIERDLTWDEIFEKIESGEIGAREEAGVAEARPALAAVASEKTKGLVEKRNKEDFEAETRRRLEAKGRRLTPEGKAREEQIRDEVTADLRSHPALSADRLLTNQSFKVDPKYLTKEQKERLPADYQAKGGVKPDEVAKILGFDSGDALVERVAMITEERKRLGLSQRDYFDKVRDEEVERRVEREAGEDLDGVRDEALSETQMALHHSEVEDAARAAGIEPEQKLEAMKGIAERVIADLPVTEIKASRFMQKAGALKLQAAEARAAGKLEKVYRLLQQHQIMMLVAKEARAYERARAAFDRTGKFYSKTPTEEVAKRIDIPYYNWIQHTMARLGFKVDEAELARRVGMEDHQTLNDFAAAKYTEGRELNIPQFVADPIGLGKLDELTHSEFMDVKRMVDTMDHEGRLEKTLESQGKKIEHDAGIEQLTEQAGQIKALPVRPRQLDRPRTVRDASKNLWWAHITPEFMWDRLDQGNRAGPFHRLLVYPLARALDKKARMIDTYRREFNEIRKGFKDMDRLVENDLFIDPNTKLPLEMRRRNVLAVLAHWGNDSNKLKLTEGWGVEPEAVEAFLRKNTTAEDWEGMQQLGKLHDKLFGEANEMAQEVTGVPIKRVKLEPFTDVFGKDRAGWYAPVDYDPYLVRGSRALTGESSFEREGTYRATTNQQYTKERTGYKGYVALDLEAIENRLGQVIHDTALRPAILQARKILYDDRFRQAIISSVGKAQYDQMTSWLQRVGRQGDVLPVTERTLNQVFGFLRVNTVANLVGFNFGTLMKHTPTALSGSLSQVGPLNFLRASFDIFRTDPATQARIYKTIYDESETVRGRMHNLADILKGEAGTPFQFEQGTLAWLRELHTNLAAMPVAFGDFASVVPTYWAAREKAIRLGHSPEEAVDIGNKAVREAHGTAGMMGQAGIMGQTSQLAKFYSSLYNIFSHILQNQYKFGWKARDIINGQVPQDIGTHWAPHMLGKFFTYFVIPAAIEEIVTPYTNEERDSWGKKIGKGLALGLASSLPVVRDFVREMLNPGKSGGLIDTAMNFPKELIQNLEKPSKQNAAKIVKYAIGTAGELGAANQSEANMAEYLTRYMTGQERPKGPWSVAAGLRYGKTDKHSKTFEEWWKHMTGGKR